VEGAENPACGPSVQGRGVRAAAQAIVPEGRRDGRVGHPELIAVIERGGPAQREQQHRRDAGLLRPHPAGQTRAVVVPQAIIGPGPGGQRAFERVHARADRGRRPRRLDQPEVEGEVQFVELGAEVRDPVVPGHDLDLADGHARPLAAVGVEQGAHLPIDRVQVGVPPVVDVALGAEVGVLPVERVRNALRVRRVIAQREVFHDHVRDIDAEAVDPALQPEA